MNEELKRRADAGGMVYAALLIATGAHTAIGQVRKYTGEPYIAHPIEVAGIVADLPDATDEMIAAALLHDVLEDTEVPLSLIEHLFGETVANYVIDLTDHYTPSLYPELNRSVRKFEEARRYAFVSPEVATIKLADGISNTLSIAKHDPKFMKTYGPEKRTLLNHLGEGNGMLWWELDRLLTEAGY